MSSFYAMKPDNSFLSFQSFIHRRMQEITYILPLLERITTLVDCRLIRAEYCLLLCENTDF